LPQASDATNGLSCAARCRNKPAWMAFGRGELWSMAGRPSVAPWVCLLLLCDRAHISAAAVTLRHPGWSVTSFQDSSTLFDNITLEGEQLATARAAVEGQVEECRMMVCTAGGPGPLPAVQQAVPRCNLEARRGRHC
jgi:hypothetical protein